MRVPNWAQLWDGEEHWCQLTDQGLQRAGFPQDTLNPAPAQGVLGWGGGSGREVGSGFVTRDGPSGMRQQLGAGV